jgi:GNAT superfamily N-acetyltransferase
MTSPLIEILPSQVRPALRALFNPQMPTAIRCMAVLGGGNAGRIFVDDLQHPQVGYVYERDDGTLYPGGSTHAAGISGMVEFLRKEGIVAISFIDGDPLVNLFPPDPEAGAECIELERPVRGSSLTALLALPEGFTVYRTSRELIEKSPRLDETLFRYGELEKYLNNGLDVCIMHGDEYVSDAGADMDVGGVREVGVVTERAYRRLGFGTIAVAHLLAWCDELGVSTYWDCVRLNIGSLKMARKLGFINERSYKRLAWFPPVREIRIGNES